MKLEVLSSKINDLSVYREILRKGFVTGAIGACFLCAVSQANATAILSPDSATYSGTSATSTDLMIDRSGLATGFTSGVTNFDTYNPANVEHLYQYGGGSINEWFANYPTSGIGEVVFDLGDLYTVDRIAFWNEDGEGISSVGVSFSLDGITYGGVETFKLTDNAWGVNYTADILALSSFTLAKFVKFNLVAANPADDGYPNLSIGEVAFSVNSPVPEPATMVLFGAGLLGLLGMRRGKNSSDLNKL
jgi:hypothetical protein